MHAPADQTSVRLDLTGPVESRAKTRSLDPAVRGECYPCRFSFLNASPNTRASNRFAASCSREGATWA